MRRNRRHTKSIADLQKQARKQHRIAKALVQTKGEELEETDLETG
jgi:hypothetical protein